MRFQNRVGPDGAIVFSRSRGTFMGNRGGVLHNGQRELVRPFASERWITCVLEFKGRRREVMTPGLYTELFFLDEAVAFAAGHRPCAECRRERFNTFKDAWKRSDVSASGPLRVPEIDGELHRARMDRGRGKVTYQASLGSLPDGSFVWIEGSSYLVWENGLLLWSHEGYVRKEERPAGLVVTVLTPEPLVQCMRGGYRAEIHKSSIGL